MASNHCDNFESDVVGLPSSEETDGATTRRTLLDLISRAKTLLSELEAFRHRLRDLRQEGNVELGHFRGTVQSELSMLQRLSDKPESGSTQHIARSSNLPFLETVWNTAKNSKEVAALQKKIYASSDAKSLSQGMRQVRLNGSGTRARSAKENAVIVDAITDAGKTWTKVSLITNSRLLFDLAKQGWDSGGSDSEDEHGTFSTSDGLDDDTDVPLLRTAKELTRAAQQFRVRTQTPKVHIVLPRIQPGEVHEVDAVLEGCRAAGAVLHCGEGLKDVPGLDIALPAMAPDPFESFSDSLNIDCTILLALVSEFSHAKVSKEPWFHTALRRQVEIEGNENLLPSLLYPAMANHPLVCTQEAASRMREIVNTIGTVSEKARTKIMMGDDTSKPHTTLVAEMQEWSAYEVPLTWRLPIKIIDQNEHACQSSLPPEAQRVSENMTAINRSVFLHGWAAGRTTITSNRTVVKQLEGGLQAFHASLSDTAWPRIWLCPTARSLVGKEKRGAAKKDEIARGAKEHTGAWPLPDPLRREEQRRNGLDVLSMREGHVVEDLRPNGYSYDDVLAAKNAARR